MAPGARATACQAAGAIAGSTRLSNAKRTCGGLADFVSKTHSQPMVMRPNRSGAIRATEAVRRKLALVQIFSQMRGRLIYRKMIEANQVC
jgi:hypothetical protein